MTEATQAAETNPETSAAPAPPADPPEERLVPASRLSGVAEEAKRWKSEATAAAKRLAEIEARDQAAAEEAAAKRGEFDQVIAAKEARIAELAAKVEQVAHAARKSEAKSLLTAHGMADSLALDGALAALPADGDLAEWVEELATKHPASFAAPTRPRAPGVPASVAPAGQHNGVNKSDLFSRDPAVSETAWQAAIAQTKASLGRG